MMHKQFSDVQLTQVKRHRKKPTVEISLSLVKRKLKKAKVDVKEAHAYILYECGHIFDKEDDPGEVKYVGRGKDSRGLRICPTCWEQGIKSPLITKYKRCGCGAEHVGKRIQPSICCASCPSSRRVAKGKTPDHIRKANKHLADPDRCFCIHRNECLVIYDGYEVLPCKGCPRFKEGTWVADTA